MQTHNLGITLKHAMHRPHGKAPIGPQAAEVVCPACGKGMILSPHTRGRAGFFFSCLASPTCRQTLPANGDGTPVPPALHAARVLIHSEARRLSRESKNPKAARAAVYAKIAARFGVSKNDGRFVSRFTQAQCGLAIAFLKTLTPEP